MSTLKSRPFWGLLHSWTPNWVLGQLCCEWKASPVYLWISREEEKADEHSCWDFACSRSQPFIGCICVFGSSVHVYLHTCVFVQDSSVNKCISREGKESSCEDEQLRRSEQIWAAEKTEELLKITSCRETTAARDPSAKFDFAGFWFGEGFIGTLLTLRSMVM